MSTRHPYLRVRARREQRNSIRESESKVAFVHPERVYQPEAEESIFDKIARSLERALGGDKKD